MTTPATGIPKRVKTFLVLAFGISWGAFAARSAVAWPSAVDEGLRLTVKFGPSLAGLLSAFRFGGAAGLGTLVRRLLFPSPIIKWVAVAFLLPIGVLAAALPLRALLGDSVLPLNALSLPGFSSLFFTLLATRFFLGGGLGEEFGWRGFMLPVLQQRMGAFNASIVIGLFHGMWHLPAYGAGVVLLTLYTVAGAIVFTWMYNRTGGNLFLPALMHATANASLPALETLVPAVDQEVLFPVLVFGVWAALAMLIVRWVGADGLDPATPRATGVGR